MKNKRTIILAIAIPLVIVLLYFVYIKIKIMVNSSKVSSADEALATFQNPNKTIDTSSSADVDSSMVNSEYTETDYDIDFTGVSDTDLENDLGIF